MKLAHMLAATFSALACTASVAQQNPVPVEIGDGPVTAAEARSTALALAGLLEADYVFPEIARRYAAGLRSNAASGAYDKMGMSMALAERLTADLQAISPDNHLRVAVGPVGSAGSGPRIVIRRPVGPAGAAAPTGPGQRRIVIDGSPSDAGPRPRIMRMPPAPPVEQARWLAPGIAFVRFNAFPGDPETVAAAARFMADHVEAKTIIFDIRTHRGGGLAEMNAIFPYLFSAPTTLVTMDTRGSVARAAANPLGDEQMRVIPAEGDIVRSEHFVTPGRSEKRLFGARVYVLTSGFTGSAAEHFALAMKRTKRATLIGETTGGAGNYGGFRPLGDRFHVFVPVGRTFDPDTGKGWEGTGVAPDIDVPAERALIEALTRSGVALAEAERLSAEVAPQAPMARISPPGS